VASTNTLNQIRASVGHLEKNVFLIVGGATPLGHQFLAYAAEWHTQGKAEMARLTALINTRCVH
jgi:hypothetical protein